MGLDSRVREIAFKLQDEKLLALSSGDLVALEREHHKSCLTTIANKARSQATKDSKKNNKKSVADGIILAELVSYIEETLVETKGVLVFKLKDLVKMYASRLQQLGFEGNVEALIK